MVIVLRLPLPVHRSLGACVLGSVEACRPTACPGCHHPQRDRDNRLVLQGHGGYVRQVRGLADGGYFLVFVRRFLCTACRVVTSVLPSWLHPWRWYGATAILDALWSSSECQESDERVRERLGSFSVEKGWRTLERWRGTFLVGATLFGWLGTVGAEWATVSSRLHRFLFGLEPDGEPTLSDWSREAVERCAVQALAGTTHRRGS